MTDQPRRRFLKQSATIVTGLAASSCAPPADSPGVAAATGLPRETLDALGNIVLPKTALGDDGIARVLDEFTTWLAELEPVAELDHYYLWTDEIGYGPPDPAPLWTSQLEALELEAEKRHGERFAALDAEAQQAILKRQLPSNLGPDLPYAGAAPHVAVGLAAYFYGTSESTDLGYGASIERQTCRGLDTAPDEPGTNAPVKG